MKRGRNPFWLFDQAELSRDARRQIEGALDHAGWPWNRRLSLLLDYLVILEEAGA